MVVTLAHRRLRPDEALKKPCSLHNSESLRSPGLPTEVKQTALRCDGNAPIQAQALYAISH